MPVDAERALGSFGAAVAIVEFADYQCPYCRNFHVSTFPKLRRDYVETGKVRYFYKDFPLPSHTHALGAAVAAHCAGEQGRYWEMQDLLYTEQARLGRELYTELGEELKLDPRRFESCLASAAAQRAVQRDRADGQQVGVRATPTFVLGRIEGDRVLVERMAVGAPNYEAFAEELNILTR